MEGGRKEAVFRKGRKVEEEVKEKIKGVKKEGRMKERKQNT